MKQLSFFVFALSISLSAFAQEQVTVNPTASPTAVNPEQPAPATTAPAVQRYIKDYILVPLRSGDTASHRIVHKGVKSGTPVTLIKENEASQYSLIKTPDGIEGWIPNQYLMEETPSVAKLAMAEDTINRLTVQAGPDALGLVDMQKKNEALTRNMQALEETNNTLSRELEHIKTLSADEVKLNEENKQLLVQYETAKREHDTIKAENQSLRDQLQQNTFINGAFAVILGILATLIIQYFAKSKKRNSDWA